MKILTWETAKNEGAMEALDKFEMYFFNHQGYIEFEVREILELIDEIKKQYK
jgi:hypothetical protein